MIDIPITKNIIDYSVELVKRNNFGLRGFADGDTKEQVRGIIGQKIIQDIFNIPIKESSGFDGGIDFTLNNITYDVKTMGRTRYPKQNYVNNLVGMQSKYNVDRYIFCSINRLEKVLTICGWINKKSFLNKAKFYKHGDIRKRFDGTTFNTKCDLYELENKELVQSNSIDEFKQQLFSFPDEF